MSYANIIDALDAQKQGKSSSELAKEALDRNKRVREDRYVEFVNSGMTRTEAAKASGFSANAARTPRKLIETPELKARMQESLIRKRVTLDTIAGRVSDALGATVVESTRYGLNATELPDHKARLKAVEIGARLWGLDQSERNTAVAVQINFPAGLADRWTMEGE